MTDIGERMLDMRVVIPKVRAPLPRMRAPLPSRDHPMANIDARVAQEATRIRVVGRSIETMGRGMPRLETRQKNICPGFEHLEAQPEKSTAGDRSDRDHVGITQ
jgi:hypothetical protein